MFNYDDYDKCLFNDNVYCTEKECKADCAFFPHYNFVVQSTEIIPKQITIEEILWAKNKN